MAEMQEFELLSSASNAVVARHPGREFPGILLQGDTLRTFLDDIEELSEEVTEGNLEQAKEICKALQERFIEILSHYEHVLDQYGQGLPYTNPVRHVD